jgi:hypothetical protein
LGVPATNIVDEDNAGSQDGRPEVWVKEVAFKEANLRHGLAEKVHHKPEFCQHPLKLKKSDPIEKEK